jgi:hypothetical protein
VLRQREKGHTNGATTPTWWWLGYKRTRYLHNYSSSTVPRQCPNTRAARMLQQSQPSKGRGLDGGFQMIRIDRGSVFRKRTKQRRLRVSHRGALLIIVRLVWVMNATEGLSQRKYTQFQEESPAKLWEVPLR